MSDRRAWEYAILIVGEYKVYWREGSGQEQDWGSSRRQDGVDPRVRFLNQIGTDGWELVTTVDSVGTEYTFKRPA